MDATRQLALDDLLDLLALKLPNTEMKSAQRFGPGEFAMPGRGKMAEIAGFAPGG